MSFMRKQPTVKEQVRTTNREVRGIQRDLGRDRTALERQERQLIADVKKCAKQGRTAEAKMLAKQVHQLRQQMDKNTKVKCQVGGLNVRAAAMASGVANAKAMAGATRIMAASNKMNDMQALQSTLSEFERQNLAMDMKDEMISDVLDGLMDESDDEQESADVLNAVLDEIGLDLTTNAAQVPRTKLSSGQSTPAASVGDRDTDPLMKRLADLRAQ
ncbi:Snf7-domain-containing protein [Fimicolochytrium jonesii]|uniref:Snf7-domain-containing protein n=1 Tax=Fimicolochytrium jonesii TaxID=1396493 RepID=UPI0022FDC5DD|nr:Snf7-domain-containing protein [Fimicolochytrium jonesii]KAI8823505.1 Snf7-domain-containing protein [Fimicolochytrium jonesii]